MSEKHTEDYLAMARSMKYSDLVKKLLKKWNNGSLGAGLFLFCTSGGEHKWRPKK